MEKLLGQVGITEMTDTLAEYKPVKLDWWDQNSDTEIEIEFWRAEQGESEVTVIFSLDEEGIVERVPIFSVNFLGEALLGSALVAEPVYENAIGGGDWPFSEEMNAYFTDDYELAVAALGSILELIEEKNPLFIGPLEENEAEGAVPEPGEFLPHFIAMLEMNAAEFKPDEIAELLETGVAYEGEAYFEGVKSDLAETDFEAFEDQFGLDEEIFATLKRVVDERKK